MVWIAEEIRQHFKQMINDSEEANLSPGQWYCGSICVLFDSLGIVLKESPLLFSTQL